MLIDYVMLYNCSVKLLSLNIHILCGSVHYTIVSDSTESLAAALSGANSLIIAVGFVPSNPLKMNAAAHEVE